MKELYTEIEINASAEKVWNILTEFSRFPEWNPFVVQAKGAVQAGEKIEVRLEPPDGAGMTIKPTLLKAEPQQELRWLGHLLIPGLFDGDHIFVLQPVGDDRVKLIHREEFCGLLVGLILSMVGENTKKGFEAMNQALKAEAEKDVYLSVINEGNRSTQCSLLTQGEPDGITSS